MIDAMVTGLERVAPVIVFLLAITVVAEICERAGLFDVVGHWLARHGRHRMLLLWLFFSGFAVVCTVFLSLDTAAVLLTPVAIAIAHQVGVPPAPFAITTLWIANTGSLLLPVSNLTNLLAVERLGGHATYVGLAMAPAVTGIVVTLAVVAVIYRRRLAARYTVDPPAEPHDPKLLMLAAVVCLMVGPAFAVGLEPWAVAVGGAVLLLGATGWRAPELLRGLPVPWRMAIGFAALVAAVSAAHDAGWLDGLVRSAGEGDGLGDLLQAAGVSAATSNVVNNLPAYLALEPAAGQDGTRLMAILIGTNMGPLVTPWASLATLLWLQRCRAAGLSWRWWRLALGGLVCATATVVCSVLVLWLTA